jgi:hypothetical protein
VDQILGDVWIVAVLIPPKHTTAMGAAAAVGSDRPQQSP